MVEVKPESSEKTCPVKDRDKFDKDRIEAKRKAVNDLARIGGPRCPTSWELVTAWRFRPPASIDIPAYLEGFGYMAGCSDKWCSPPNFRGPELVLSLGNHCEAAGCTWYITDCTLVPCKIDVHKPTCHWPAPRRLVHLRKDLHDPVKKKLGQAWYSRIFGETPFARHWGPVGTTARLRGWITALVKAVNAGDVPPFVVALVMSFFHAPGCSDEETTYPPPTCHGEEASFATELTTTDITEEEDYQPIEEQKPKRTSDVRELAPAVDLGHEEHDLRKASWVPGFLDTDTVRRVYVTPAATGITEDAEFVRNSDSLETFGKEPVQRTSLRLKPGPCKDNAGKLKRNNSSKQAWTITTVEDL